MAAFIDGRSSLTLSITGCHVYNVNSLFWNIFLQQPSISTPQLKRLKITLKTDSI